MGRLSIGRERAEAGGEALREGVPHDHHRAHRTLRCAAGTPPAAPPCLRPSSYAPLPWPPPLPLATLPLQARLEPLARGSKAVPTARLMPVLEKLGTAVEALQIALEAEIEWRDAARSRVARLLRRRSPELQHLVDELETVKLLHRRIVAVKTDSNPILSHDAFEPAPRRALLPKLTSAASAEPEIVAIP